MTRPENTYEIVIVGGGLAGGLAATALAASGFSCALIDGQDPAALRSAAYDGRTTALAYAAARVFRRLGVWDAIAPAAGPIRDILVTDGRATTAFRAGAVSPFHLHFDSAELEPQTPLGWIVENRVLRDAIYDRISAADNIAVFAPARWTQLMREPGVAALTLSTGETLRASLVIAADGRFSQLRDAAEIRVNQWRYRQTGIVATVAHERDHEGVAQEFFLPSGPFAILPMAPRADDGSPLRHRSSLVWTEREAAAPAYLAMSEADFNAALADRFGPYLGALGVDSPRWSYPLAFHLAHDYAAHRLALIGDAAHAIHPIAGQGYNLGVKDIAALVDVLVEARSVGLDIGAMTVLQKYQQWRRFDSASLALGTDVLNRLFSNDFGPLRLARDIGMGAVNAVGPLRRFFMRQAGADAGSLPSLMAREAL